MNVKPLCRFAFLSVDRDLFAEQTDMIRGDTSHNEYCTLYVFLFDAQNSAEITKHCTCHLYTVNADSSATNPRMHRAKDDRPYDSPKSNQGPQADTNGITPPARFSSRRCACTL